MKFKQLRKKMKEKAQQVNKKVWSNSKPQTLAPEIDIYCDRCKQLGRKCTMTNCKECESTHICTTQYTGDTTLNIMLPKKLLPPKELKEILKKNFGIKHIPVSYKVFERSYIYFVCPKCGWEKFTKLTNIIGEGYINPDICKTCESDVCEWVNCTKGGYIKGENTNE